MKTRACLNYFVNDCRILQQRSAFLPEGTEPPLTLIATFPIPSSSIDWNVNGPFNKTLCEAALPFDVFE